jgi:hypothetical protein
MVLYVSSATVADGTMKELLRRNMPQYKRCFLYGVSFEAIYWRPK